MDFGLTPGGGGSPGVCLNSATPAFAIRLQEVRGQLLTEPAVSITTGGVVTGLTTGTVSIVYTYNNGSCTDL